MSHEAQGIKLFWRDIPGFCRDIPEAPEKFEKKMFGFNIWPLNLKRSLYVRFFLRFRALRDTRVNGSSGRNPHRLNLLGWHLCRTKLPRKVLNSKPKFKYECRKLGISEEKAFFLCFLDLQVLFSSSGKGRKRQKKDEKGRFPGKAARHPLSPHLLHPQPKQNEK